MSSYEREPLTGVIRQENRVVGSVCLPEEDQQEFIDEFNHCYGPLRLRIELKPHSNEKLVPLRTLRPVGAPYQPRRR